MGEQQSRPHLSDRTHLALLEEYKANIDLWIYEVTYRQERSQTFLTVNTVLLVALGTLVTISSSIATIAISAVLISVFGASTCTMWHRILVRNGAYLRFRGYQLRAIEAKLQEVTTITNQWKALSQYKELALLDDPEDRFAIKPSAKISSVAMESRLPLIMTGLWALTFIGGIVAIGLYLARWI